MYLHIHIYKSITLLSTTKPANKTPNRVKNVSKGESNVGFSS